MIAYLYCFSNLGWITTASQSKAVWLMHSPPTSWPGSCRKTCFFIKENIFGSLILYSDLFSFTVAFEKQKKCEVGIQITWVYACSLMILPFLSLPSYPASEDEVLMWGSYVSVISLKEQHQGQLIGSCRTLMQLAQPLFLWVRKSTVANVFFGVEGMRGGIEGIWEESASFWYHLRVITSSQLNKWLRRLSSINFPGNILTLVLQFHSMYVGCLSF